MELITKQSLIDTVGLNWQKHYPENFELTGGEFSNKILEKLEKLPATRTEEDIAKVIGNYSWTEINCEECGESVDEVIVFTEAAKICKRCLKKALDL